MNKKDLIIWIALVLLTLFSFFSSESSLGKGIIALVLVAVTGIKFLGVGFQFMELKKAHSFWQTAFTVMFLIYVILVLSLT